MDIFSLEKQRIQLSTQLNSVKSPLTCFLLINDFYEKLKSFNNPNIIEVFLNDVLTYFISSLQMLNFEGLAPQILLKLENFIAELSLLDFEKELKEMLLFKQAELKEYSSALKEILDSNKVASKPSILSFPVIINEHGFPAFGNIDSLSIRINQTPKAFQNEILIIPALGKIEERLESQIKNSWALAVNYFQNYFKRKLNYHQIIIILGNKFTNYEGYSLGFTLTIGFLQELFKYYNTSLSIIVKSNLTLTGGFNENGKSKNLGVDIIETKTKTVFFSANKYFVLPAEDYIFAQAVLNKLNSQYPNRQLKLIPILDFEDLISNRQILQIEKAKVKTRVKKFTKQNGLALVLSAILITIIALYSIFTIDKNPTGFKVIGSTVHILNKYGNILWTTDQPEGYIDKTIRRLVDIDNDGINEIILGVKAIGNDLTGRIACFSNTGNLIWNYKFNDTIKGISKTYNLFHSNYIIDLTTINDTLVIYCFANHDYWPCAIYSLNAKTGERLSGTLWSIGHFTSGEIGDFNNDGKKELIAAGVNNGFEKAFLIHINLDKINGQTIGIGDYKFKDLPIAEFNEYILISKSDLSEYHKMRYNFAHSISYSEIYDRFIVSVLEAMPDKSFQYWFTKDFGNVTFSIGDDFQYERDDLVKKGLIDGPLTMDPKYEEQLIDGIQRWNGKEFVKFINQKKK